VNQHTFNMLEFQQIKVEISNFALTKEGKEKILNLVPSTNVKQIVAWLEEVTEAVEILKISGSVPVHGLDGLTAILQNMNKGAALRVEQLIKLYDFLDSCGKMRR